MNNYFNAQKLQPHFLSNKSTILVNTIWDPGYIVSKYQLNMDIGQYILESYNNAYK